MPTGRRPLAPSAIRPDPNFRGYAYTAPAPRQTYEEPRALDRTGIAQLISSYAAAARRAVDAGFDGVELHAGSGYLPMQFLSSNTNRRNDGYGGSPARRARFALEATEAMASAIGAGRVSIKLSPGSQFNDVRDEDPRSVYTELLSGLTGQGFAHVQVSDFGEFYAYAEPIDWLGLAREQFDGLVVANGGLDRGLAESPSSRHRGGGGLRLPVHLQPGSADACVGVCR